MNKKRTILIGDAHGCRAEFEELLEKINYNKDEDRVILLGDLVDRGPDSLGMVQMARKLGLESVLGNHEHRLLKWLKNHYVGNIPEYYKQFTKEDIEYIKKMPLYIKIDDNSVAIHAGLKPYLPLNKQDINDFLYLRYTTKAGKFISVKKILLFGKTQCDAYFWTDLWDGSMNVIYGHNVFSYENIKINEFDNSSNKTYGIDTGCCFGGHLSALIWETKEIVQVKAKKDYTGEAHELIDV